MVNGEWWGIFDLRFTISDLRLEEGKLLISDFGFEIPEFEIGGGESGLSFAASGGRFKRRFNYVQTILPKGKT